MQELRSFQCFPHLFCTHYFIGSSPSLLKGVNAALQQRLQVDGANSPRSDTLVSSRAGTDPKFTGLVIHLINKYMLAPMEFSSTIAKDSNAGTENERDKVSAFTASHIKETRRKAIKRIKAG